MIGTRDVLVQLTNSLSVLGGDLLLDHGHGTDDRFQHVHEVNPTNGEDALGSSDGGREGPERYIVLELDPTGDVLMEDARRELTLQGVSMRTQSTQKTTHALAEIDLDVVRDRCAKDHVWRVGTAAPVHKRKDDEAI